MKSVRLASRSGNLRAALTGCIVLGLVFGCAAETRPVKTRAELLEARKVRDARMASERQEIMGRLVTYTKSRYDEYKAGRLKNPPTIDMLIISGGGSWGAFGTGFLKGWGKVEGPMTRPTFSVVTGVSTGALIAPFAFLGDDASIDVINNIYRNPKKDWFELRKPFFFLPKNPSFGTIPGLEKEMREHVTPEMVRRIADAGKGGRVILVNTTDADDGTMYPYNLVAEADRAAKSGEYDRVQQVLLASCAIPGVFPFRTIDGYMYVDGGGTGNILYGGRLTDAQSLPALWKAAYPDIPIPKVRYWVLINNPVRLPPQVTGPTWPEIVVRSADLSIHSATLTAVRHLFAMCEIQRLKYGADVEARMVGVPDDWVPPGPGGFEKETMQAMSDLGEKMGADPNSWLTEPP